MLCSWLLLNRTPEPVWIAWVISVSTAGYKEKRKNFPLSSGLTAKTLRKGYCNTRPAAVVWGLNTVMADPGSLFSSASHPTPPCVGWEPWQHRLCSIQTRLPHLSRGKFLDLAAWGTCLGWQDLLLQHFSRRIWFGSECIVIKHCLTHPKASTYGCQMRCRTYSRPLSFWSGSWGWAGMF